jgi:cytochrome c-type biogenesis protein CcmH
MNWRWLFRVAMLSILVVPAYAVLPDEQLADPNLEARARHISQELRCVVCQNQTIDDSDAELAHDLRVILRERLLAGDTDAQAASFIVNRYGTYVLLKPPFEQETFLLWLGPFLVLAAGGVVVVFYLRGRSAIARMTEKALSADEHERLAGLLEQRDAT